ncbi:MAG TPA: hypothetical protein VGG65_04815, partial [Thermoanaerobaculia bacterium]
VFPYKDHPSLEAQPSARVVNLTDHGGPTITSAKVLSIFWGPSWGTNASPSALALGLMGFFAQYGTTGEYNVITQYSGIHQSNLTNQYWVDGVNPSNVAVTDAMIQAEVVKYFAGGNPIDDSTIYEVFLPTGYYSTLGNATSCGGPHLQYCAYHSNFSYNGHDVKYSSMPQPSCSGCQSTGFTTAQNFEHFATHETREAVTDPDGNAWYDRQGNEADDKCAWSPTPFIDGGYGYQYEWSNADRKCVKTR